MRTIAILALLLACADVPPPEPEEVDDPVEDSCICDGAQGECRPHPYNVHPIECEGETNADDE